MNSVWQGHGMELIALFRCVLQHVSMEAIVQHHKHVCVILLDGTVPIVKSVSVKLIRNLIIKRFCFVQLFVILRV